MRFVWDYNEKYLKEKGQRGTSFFARMTFNYLRIWDRLAAERPDYLIANSAYTAKRIDKYYRRESTVIYPPVGSVSVVNKSNDQLLMTDYFLVVSRLSPYKKVDLVVEAFNKLGLPLIVIGAGQQEEYLKKIAKDNVKILGWQSDGVVAKYYEDAQAFIFPCEDDFGIAPVEAMQHGVPVIAFRHGGVCETVQEGVTGEFFDAQTPEVLADGVRRFLNNKSSYKKDVIIARGEEFSKERFQREFKKFVNEKMA
jgi:glycosyltransferase involved in cell wall biosynthesis